MSAWRLADLVGVDSLQRIQDTFARTFGLPTAILDPDGRYATAITNRSAFCEDVARGSVVAGPRCADCDLYAQRAAHNHKGVSVFECWNGLYDAAVPISARGQLLGYFLCGQVFEQPPERARHARTAVEIRVDPAQYEAALAQVPVVPFARYEAALESMHVLAGLIAEQALSAIESMRMLETATRARADSERLVGELDGILGALRDIGAQPDYETTLQAIDDQLGQLVPTDASVVYVLDPGSRELVPAFVRDPLPEQLLAHRPSLADSFAGRVASSAQPFVSDDVTREPGFVPIPGVPVEPESAVIVPLVHKQRVLGVLSLSRFGAPGFTAHEVRLLTVLAAEAAVALEVSRLASENREASAERARLHGRERELLVGYQRLSALTAELAGARDAEQARAALIARTPGVVGSDSCLIALVAQRPDRLRVDVGNARGHEHRTVDLRGAGRVAALRLRDEDDPSRSVFDAFVAAVLERVHDGAGDRRHADRAADGASVDRTADGAHADGAAPRAFVAEPLTAGRRVLGALIVAWDRAEPPPRAPAPPAPAPAAASAPAAAPAPESERERLLRMLAGAAGANLDRLAAATATDDALRDRLAELRELHVATEQHKARLERILAIHEALAATAIGARGLPSILRALGELLDADLLAVGARGGELARWPPDCDLAWSADAEQQRAPRVVEAELPGGGLLLTAPVAAGADLLGWLVARTVGEAPEVERAAVEHGALLVGLELLRERTALDVEMRMRGGFLEDLLGETHAPELLVRQARAFELDLLAPSRVVIAAREPTLAAGGAATGATAATGAAGALRGLYDTVGRCATAWPAGAFVAVKGDTVVAVVQERDDEVQFEHELLQRLERQGDRTVQLAVGTRTEAVADFRRSHRAALRGIELLRLRLVGEQQRLFSFRVSSVETLLFEMNEPQAVLDFVARYVRPLDDYDRQHTSELRRTLETYFASGGRLAECARRLHIHVATLRYRLDKVAQLLDADVRDPRVALDLQVALRAAQLGDVQAAVTRADRLHDS